jgi:Fusaric acid resistance protein-like
VPVWSEDALLRAIRATIVIPGLFAFADQVVGNVQIATFVAFGGFATLVMSSFGGTRRDKAAAHLELALTGTVLIVIGTLVSSSTAVAAVVTVLVAFAVLFAGLLGPNTAAGASGALLAYVLPTVSGGGVGTIPDRLAGWWMVSVVGTAAVLILSRRPPADRLRGAGAALATSLSEEIDAALTGHPNSALRDASLARKTELRAVFTATPYRPTGLATPDQALSNLVELLEWCCALAGETVAAAEDISVAPDEDRVLLSASSALMRAVAALLQGQETVPDVDGVERLLFRAAGMASDRTIPAGGEDLAAHLTFHARNLAVAARAAATDALIASRRADDATIAAARRRWYGALPESTLDSGTGRDFGALGVAARHASLRSVWFLNSLRGALAIAAAVSVADLTAVQHGFWVVLGTLSVLRANAASTGATAMRAIVGTVAGFAIGSVLVLAIGSGTTALWVVLPISVFVAAYAPGTAPFAAGQAAFTVLVAVLFNLLLPVGWKVGVVRIEDVALGCAVSVVVGVLFWPRGAAGIVGDDLADAFRRGSTYLSESVNWVLGRSTSPPQGGVATVAASLRLDDALRGLLSEQGAKRVAKEHLWNLVGATMRLRLTAHALAGTHPAAPGFDEARDALTTWSDGLVNWYGQVAADLEGHSVADGQHLERALPSVPAELSGAVAGTPVCIVWVGRHLLELRDHLADIIDPVVEVSAMRRLPWWR